MKKNRWQNDKNIYNACLKTRLNKSYKVDELEGAARPFKVKLHVMEKNANLSHSLFNTATWGSRLM